MDIVKIGVLGIAGVLLSIPFKRERNEFSMLLSMVLCICIFFYIITKIETVLNFTKTVGNMIPIDGSYIGLVIKMVGITYAAEFAVNICKDAGYGAIASQIEVFAKMSLLVSSLPVLTAFLEMIGSMV